MLGASLIIEEQDDIVCGKKISEDDMCASEEEVYPQNNATEVAFVSWGRMEENICWRFQQQYAAWHGESLL